MTLSDAISLDNLLPHKSPMILLDKYMDFNAEYIQTQVTIRQHSVFCQNGTVPSYVSLEYMAQTIGVWRGLLAKCDNEKPKIGFLISCRRLTLKKDFFHVNDILKISGQLKCYLENMATFDCWVDLNNQTVAHGIVNVFQSDEEI